MGIWYDSPPESLETQHGRLGALRKLMANEIPCILWGEDALAFAHSVPTALFDQQILVPDELLDAAAAVLEDEKYKRTSELPRNYVELFKPYQGAYAFPRSFRLRHSDIPEDDPYKLWPIPRHILLLPQSYYALDARDESRFQSFVPPLDSSNAGILVPKYHTFLEGLVNFIMYPPTGRLGSSQFHYIFINYLTLYRIKELPHIKNEILSEIQTEDCAWYMGITLFRRRTVSSSEIEEYKRQKGLRNGYVNRFHNLDSVLVSENLMEVIMCRRQYFFSKWHQ